MARENLERTGLFTMRVNREERQLLAALAERERQPAADVIRALVRKALQDQTERPAKSAEALMITRP